MKVPSTADAHRERFTAIYEANYHRILGYALRRTSRDDTADVVAETFLVAWRRLGDVLPVPSGRRTLPVLTRTTLGPEPLR